MENKTKILLTENASEFSREELNAVSNMHFELHFCGKDTIEIINKIAQIRPNAVILETFLSNNDCLSVIKNESILSMVQKPIFVTVSAFKSHILEEELLSNGAKLFVTKPYSLISTCERISDILNEQSSSKGFYQMNEIAIELQVTEILHMIGVPAHIKGYHYLRDSIMMSIETPDIINAVTKQLYPSVAKKHSTTSSRVERAIRHAIEVAWDRGDVDVLNSYFGYTIHNGRGKPTNSEFIAMISDKLRLKLKSAS